MTDEYLTGPKGTYRLLQRIGAGGMGVVHLALDEDGRTIAVKELHPALADDDMLRRLEREVATMRRVSSPYVAEIYDADVTGERPFVATRYVQGRALDRTLRERGPLVGPQLAHVARNLAMGLRAIHDAGVIHRDLKPSNVMLSEGDPVIIDFGISQAVDSTRLTHTGMVVGTPGYVAPEVVNGDEAERPADVFSWAATIAYAATGRSPFGTGPAEVIFFRVTGGQSDLHGVPEPLLPILRAALARDPGARPTAGDLVDRLASVQIEPPDEAPGPVPPPPPPKPYVEGPGEPVGDATAAAAIAAAAAAASAFGAADSRTDDPRGADSPGGGAAETGDMPARSGTGQIGTGPTGTDVPGAGQTGAGQTGAGQTGAGQTGEEVTDPISGSAPVGGPESGQAGVWPPAGAAPGGPGSGPRPPRGQVPGGPPLAQTGGWGTGPTEPASQAPAETFPETRKMPGSGPQSVPGYPPRTGWPQPGSPYAAQQPPVPPGQAGPSGWSHPGGLPPGQSGPQQPQASSRQPGQSGPQAPGLPGQPQPAQTGPQPPQVPGLPGQAQPGQSGPQQPVPGYGQAQPGYPGGPQSGYAGQPVPGQPGGTMPDYGQPASTVPAGPATSPELQGGRLGIGLAALTVAGATGLAYVLPVFGILVAIAGLIVLGVRGRIRPRGTQDLGDAVVAAGWRAAAVFAGAGVVSWLVESVFELIVAPQVKAGGLTGLASAPATTILAVFVALTVLLACAVPRWRTPARALAVLVAGGPARYVLIAVAALAIIAALFTPAPAWFPLPLGSSATFGDVLK